MIVISAHKALELIDEVAKMLERLRILYSLRLAKLNIAETRFKTK